MNHERFRDRFSCIDELSASQPKEVTALLSDPPQDGAEAAKRYRRAAEQGVATAQLNLEFMYHQGEGVPRDYAEAAKWYRRAAKQGDPDASLLLSFMYDRGKGVPQDDAEAKKWYRRAVERGHPEL